MLEGRIALEDPGDGDEVCGIATLTPLDMAASKLLANSDRGADDGVFNRDLIDQGMMQAMGIEAPQAVVWQRIRALRRVLPSDT